MSENHTECNCPLCSDKDATIYVNKTVTFMKDLLDEAKKNKTQKAFENALLQFCVQALPVLMETQHAMIEKAESTEH